MRNLFYILLGFILFSAIAVSGYTQPHSENALRKSRIYSTPEIWEINKSVANEYLNVDLFHYPRSG